MEKNWTILHQKYTVPTFKSGYQTMSVRLGFSMRGRTQIVGTVGPFDKHTHRFITDNHIPPFMYDGGPASFVLQKDNCGPLRINLLLHI